MSDTTLAARAVACKGWRWLAGMLDADGCRVFESDHGRLWIADSGSMTGDTIECVPIAVTDLPDLDDPATLGCLLALVREAWDFRACAVAAVLTARGPRWAVSNSETHAIGGKLYPTEAEALVAALEAAP